MRTLAALWLLLFAVSTARAQDSVIVIDPDAPPSDSLELVGPPPEVVAELIAFYNDTTTTRVQGDVTFPADSRFQGRLALHRGNLRIAGHVDGPIAVANGTLHLLPGADVQGDILVIGGRLIRCPGCPSPGPAARVLGRRSGGADGGGSARDSRAPPADRRSGRGANQLPDRQGPHDAVDRDRGDLQPRRGSAHRLRAHVRPSHRPPVRFPSRPPRHPAHRRQRSPPRRLRLPGSRRVSPRPVRHRGPVVQ